MMTTTPHLCHIVEAGQAHEGAWNMACDEVLLEQALSHSRASVRVYGWTRPTVSLGYFQDAGSLDHEVHLAGLDRVRRLSGGGTIVHHHEWTYSCVVPPHSDFSRAPLQLYDAVHAAIIDLLQGLGFALTARGPARDTDTPPVLCFARSAPQDLLVGDCKVLGSAQRRRRGAVLQHGSLLVRTSPHAPLFPGLLELVPQHELPCHFPVELATTIATTISPSVRTTPLEPEDLERIGELAQRHYAATDRTVSLGSAG